MCIKSVLLMEADIFYLAALVLVAIAFALTFVAGSLTGWNL